MANDKKQQERSGGEFPLASVIVGGILVIQLLYLVLTMIDPTGSIRDAGGFAGGGSYGGGGGDGSAPAAGIKMHRLYNPNSYEHFYTADDDEFANLVSLGWRYEGYGWTAPATGNSVYRLYNPNYGGDHHYTMNAEERDTLIEAGWIYEGVGWRSAPAEGGVPVFREYNPNELSRNHNYTADRAEHNNLVGLGWHDEFIAWYGV